ncbi:(2Fe-2S)-binding protein [Streptomyces mobaraensis]|uniref:Bacterioferritin-associated ferredoxin n=1 Tax=Streptomyces mobaraensis TaxID=35621 RepID=A0A5N5W6S8_STRMB|nr:(2Fe-2S)-binding protein [Streptomyces mobaraensis]
MHFSRRGGDRVYVCSCFGITEQQVREHADNGACTPRQIASACKAGTDCGSCVRRIQALLGRGACPRRELVDQGSRDPLGAEANGPVPSIPPAPPVVPPANGIVRAA